MHPLEAVQRHVAHGLRATGEQRFAVLDGLTGGFDLAQHTRSAGR